MLFFCAILLVEILKLVCVAQVLCAITGLILIGYVKDRRAAWKIYVWMDIAVTVAFLIMYALGALTII